MLNLSELFIDYFAVLVLGPLVLLSLCTGTLPPKPLWLSKYYLAEKRLLPVGNVFLLTVIGNALRRLLVHYGILAPGEPFWLEPVMSVAFFLMLCVYGATWVRALRKVWRMAPNTSSL